MALDKNDGTFSPSIEGVISGKTSQVSGMNGLLNDLIGNDNYLKGKKLDKGNYTGTAEDLSNDIKGRLPYVNTIEDLKKQTKYAIGDIVEVLGYYEKGDGAGHPRIKKPEGYNGADAVIGIDGSIWGIVHSGEVNVSWFGSDVLKAINCNAKIINFENKSFNIISQIEIPDNKTLINGKFISTKGLQSTFVCGNDNTFENLEFVSEKDEYETISNISAILCGSPTVGVEIIKENIVIRNVKVSNYVGTAFWIHSAKNVLVEKCEINNVGYAGVLCIACEDTIVSDCYIDGIIRQNRGDIAYGITFTGDKILFKESKNCIAKSNTIKNIPTWNGLDTHGGTDIHFINNKLYDCNFPIGIVDLESQSVDRKGSHNVFVVDNLINNFNLRNNGYLGITISGGATGDYWAENIVISNNTLICLGNQTSNVNGAIRITRAKNVSVTGNIIDRPMPYGVCIYNNVKGFNISDNTIINANSNTHISCAIATRGQANIGSIHGNRLVYTEDINTNTADRGIWVAQDSESSVNIFGNTGNYKTDVVSPYINSIVKLVDGTGGVSGSNLLEITPTYNQAILANNFKRLNDRLSQIIDTLELNAQVKKYNIGLFKLGEDRFVKKMQKEGIYEEYVAYRDELYEYENSQVADETMLLPVLHEPVIPESVKAFAEKYNLI